MIPFSNATIFYMLLSFIALCGFGVVFLNAESILALCFFVFLFLMIRNSDPLSDTLDDLKQSIILSLTSSLIEGEKNILRLRSFSCEQKGQLFNSIGPITSIASQKAQSAFSPKR